MTDFSAITTAALDYAERGWRVIALHTVNPKSGEGCTCRKGVSCGGSTGKHPIDSDWEKTEPYSPEQIVKTFNEGWRKPNVGVATGAPSGFWVWDIDTDAGKPGAETMAELVQQHGKLPRSRVHKTGGGGIQYLFQMPEGVEIRNKNDLLPGIDIRGTGGQIVMPPSVSGKGAYELLVDEPIAVAPDWMLALVRPKTPTTQAVTANDVPAVADLDNPQIARFEKYTANVRGRELDRLKELREKGWQGPAWNATTFKVACQLVELSNSRWNAYSQQDARGDLFENSPRDEDGFDDTEIEKIWQSALTKVGSTARPLPEDRQRATASSMWDDNPDIEIDPALKRKLPSPSALMPIHSWDDLGNAERMVDHYKNSLRWVREARSWAVYSNGRWNLESTELALGLTQRMIDSLPDIESAHYSDTDIFNPGEKKEVTMRKAFLDWVKRQRMDARFNACLSVARGRPDFASSLADYDADPDALNVGNGIVNLRTGDLEPADPTRLHMLQSPVHYDPTAKAEAWQVFLDRVVPSQEMQLYIQRIIGYSLSGHISERAFFLHHGRGANGKSVLLETIGDILGDYSQVVPPQTLLEKTTTEHPTSIARMASRRFLQLSETGRGKRLDEPTLRGLTGGERQTARMMGKDFFDFKPTGKIQMATNHLPRLSDADATWERIHLLMWRIDLPRHERELGLAQRLIRDESPGILAWCVRGAQMWYEQGLNPPIEAIADKMAYREDQDDFGDFLRSRCQIVLPNEDGKAPRVSTSELFEAYRGWCFQSGITKPMRIQVFSQVMEERKFKRYRTGTTRGYEGIRLLSNDVWKGVG